MNLATARQTAADHILWAKAQGQEPGDLLNAIDYKGVRDRDWVTVYYELTDLAWLLQIKNENRKQAS